MLNFLRKLRRNNMNSQYLKYALGEILLVVIGILIALSINNWNEDRKAEDYELLLLQEIENAIHYDIKLIDEQFIRRTLRKDSAVQALKELVISNSSVSEQVLIRLIEQTGGGFAQRYNSGPYEALKSNGLDKIKNDSLRALLVSSYDEKLPARMGFISYFNDLYRAPIDDAKRSLIGSRVVDQDGKATIVEYLKTDNALDNPRLHDLLNFEERIAQHSLDRLGQMKEILSNVSVQIQKELRRRKKIQHD